MSAISAAPLPDPAHTRWVDEAVARVDEALAAAIPPRGAGGLTEVMAYASLQGGKRLRPLLVLAACEALGGSRPAALRAAVAVELIHAYSLVHDDLPCMDDDVLRRGQPTTHVVHGEAMAMLAGDAMQALAFEVLTPETGIAPALQARWVACLARAAGHAGMAGGQAIDLMHVGKSLDLAGLEHMHALKTGCLLQASVAMGAMAGDADSSGQHQLASCVDQPVWPHLMDYGRWLGLAFQVVDDILDVTQDSSTLGKTAGKDEASNKPTFVSLMGLAAAQAYALDIHARALAALDACHLPLPGARPLRDLAHQVVSRSH
ncbi:polyprenyl synthetase family protein [Amphibiibacter pelophylacis]|uniref:Polyprenyl synthetase family protein n=1 Tax=Amphibiibacter pelophylacis TaxID=1799477 RepID=A0ACC6P3L2_9BURK